jgi:hypothetical protein
MTKPLTQKQLAAQQSAPHASTKTEDQTMNQDVTVASDTAVIANDTVVSANSGGANIIDYSIDLRPLLQFVERIAIAEEAISGRLAALAAESVKQTAHLAVLAENAPLQTFAQQVISAEAAAQTPLFERIAVSNEGIRECCRSGRVDAEAFVEITMRYHNETPAQRWARYEAFLMRDVGIPNGTV